MMSPLLTLLLGFIATLFLIGWLNLGMLALYHFRQPWPWWFVAWALLTGPAMFMTVVMAEGR